MRKILRWIVMFVSLISVFLFHLFAGVMFLGFLAWLTLNTLNFYLSYSHRQIDAWPLITGVIGTVYILAVNKDAKYVVGKSLRETVDFINRFLPVTKKEVEHDKR